jgi:hypothetical protein
MQGDARRFEQNGGACPSTLLAQVRYLVSCVVIESCVNTEYDGLKAELQQSFTYLSVGARPSANDSVCPDHLDCLQVTSTCEGFRVNGGACPSTLLAQVRYLVPCVVIESFVNTEYDGLKAELQQSFTYSKRWGAPFGKRQRMPRSFGLSVSHFDL